MLNVSKIFHNGMGQIRITDFDKFDIVEDFEKDIKYVCDLISDNNKRRHYEDEGYSSLITIKIEVIEQSRQEEGDIKIDEHTIIAKIDRSHDVLKQVKNINNKFMSKISQMTNLYGNYINDETTTIQFVFDVKDEKLYNVTFI